MAVLVAVALYIFALHCNTVLGATYDDIEMLHNMLLEKQMKHIRPAVNTETPVVVGVSYNPININEFDEVNGVFAINGFFSLSWHDHRLSWNESDFKGVTHIELPSSEVWTPSLTLLNSFKELDRLGGDFIPVVALSSGHALWHPGSVLKGVCNVDVTKYPFDKQTCDLNLIPWGYSISEISFALMSSDFNLEAYRRHGTWELLKSNVSLISGNGFSQITLFFNIERRSKFYVISYVLPISLMMILNVMVFVLPVDSGERVSYSITVLLAVAVFLTLVGDNLPKTSLLLSNLCYFLLGELMFSFVCCVMTILTLHVYHLPEERTVPVCLKKLIGKKRKSNRDVYIKGEKNLDTHIGLPRSTKVEDHTDEDTEVRWKTVVNFLDKIMLVLGILVLILVSSGYLINSLVL